MVSHSQLSHLLWVLAAASAFAFSVLLVFATADDEISSLGLAAFALSAMLFVGLACSHPRGSRSAQHQQRGRLAGPKPGARLPG